LKGNNGFSFLTLNRGGKHEALKIIGMIAGGLVALFLVVTAVLPESSNSSM